ncbi:MAG: (E)-4-hydroxy-3-methylbut-2-enyl-diphosphate synthase [Bacteroidota bacterium]
MSSIFRSQTIDIGNLSLGGSSPVRIQSMTNTNTNHVDASVDQCLRMISAGAELVRLTTQGSREVKSLSEIIDRLHEMGIPVPVVADIHFRPNLALEAAAVAHKIRINPGNYLKGGNPETLLPRLLDVCRRYGTAIRIGVNHGSLDESILREYGDTPAGMVESAMRFLRICKSREMEKVLVSLKSSNPLVMIQSVRLLAHTMAGEGMNYPLHLGVTEAGDGMEARIKSAVGIAPLLLEGMGDTIRVSLTEPPEKELPVARTIVELFPKPDSDPQDPFSNLAWDPFAYQRRKSLPLFSMGNASPVKIISKKPPLEGEDLTPNQVEPVAVSFNSWTKIPALLESGNGILLLERKGLSMGEIKANLNEFCLMNSRAPVVYKTILAERDPERFILLMAGELGSLLVDGAIDAVWVESPFHSEKFINEMLLSVLQAARARISKTEYIACPSCGRTHFDILSRLKEIRKATSHLDPIKIGIMGCIVNGPGEMADADYGYVGAGAGRVTLYRGSLPVQQNIPEKEALAALIDLIKKEGDWRDPPK